MFIHQANWKGELGHRLHKRCAEKNSTNSAFRSRLFYVHNAKWTGGGQAMPADSPKVAFCSGASRRGVGQKMPAVKDPWRHLKQKREWRIKNLVTWEGKDHTETYVTFVGSFQNKGNGKGAQRQLWDGAPGAYQSSQFPAAIKDQVQQVLKRC